MTLRAVSALLTAVIGVGVLVGTVAFLRSLDHIGKDPTVKRLALRTILVVPFAALAFLFLPGAELTAREIRGRYRQWRRSRA